MMHGLFEELSTWTTITTALVAVVLLPLLYYGAIFAAFLHRIRKMAQAVDKFPGPTKHWLMGNLHQHPGLNDKGIAFMRDLASKHERAYRLWVGPFHPIVSVFHPDLFKVVARSSEPKEMELGYAVLKSWLGDGLLLASGRKWHRNRRMLTPAFHFDVLRPYMKIYNEATDILLEKFAAASECGKSVEVSKPICLCTLNVILRCAFSSDEEVQREGETNPYVNSVLHMAKLISERLFNPFTHSDTVFNLTSNGRIYNRTVDFAHDVTRDVIRKRQNTLKESNEVPVKKCPDFLDILLLAKDAEGKGLSDTEIQNEVDTFMFEGHDTTASAISWILYELARHQEHQEECRQEVDRLLEGRTDNDILWDDLHEMPHLTMFIKESMRLNSPVPSISRLTTKEFELDGIVLPKRTPINLRIHLMHTNKTVWGEDVLEFKPERFHPDRMKDMDPFAFVPFSAGPRNCIGQNFAMHEIKVVVAKVLYRFELMLDTNHKPEQMIELVLRAKNGIKLFFKSRV